jgi:dipeptidyl aminopeptidase/acylaminoacyl peptidase
MASRHPITVDDIWALPRVGPPVPAADGSFAIVPVRTFSMDTNEGTTRLWRVPSDGSEPRALTTAEASSGQPSLSPDGKRLAFVRKPGGPKGDGKAKAGPRYPDVPQIYVMRVDGGEPERLTDLPLGAADPRWFSDGRRVAFLAALFKDALTVEKTADLAKEREEEPVKAVVTEDRVYRYWDRYLTDGKVHHLFAIDADTRAMSDLTPSSTRWFPLDEPSDNYRIAPDGREVAYSAVRSDPPHDPILYGVFTAPVPDTLGGGGAPAPAPAAPKCVTADHAGHAYRPVYSPDGRWLLYGLQKEVDFYADRTRLVALDRASGKHTILTEFWDLSSAGWTFSADSKTAFLEAEVGGRTALFALDLAAAMAAPGTAKPKELVRGGTFTPPQPGGTRLFTTRESLSEPPEVYTCAPDGGDLRRLTRFTSAIMETLELGPVQEILFEGAGGRQVQMYLVDPPGGVTPGGPLPLVQVIHGGPHAASGDVWHWRWSVQAFAAPGYRVATVNFHGSTGWGQDFAASILGRWGDRPYQDIMAATDLLVARGLADPTRMAAAGGSYGGYLSAWIASQTDRFACIVNHAGVSDLATQWASDITQGRRRAMGGTPWEDIEAMDRFNPMRHASGFRSPMLILHGEKDYRVPFDQALEIYNVHKAKHVPARLVAYPDENHWILKPRNSKHWFGEVMGWLARYIGKDAK